MSGSPRGAYTRKCTVSGARGTEQLSSLSVRSIAQAQRIATLVQAILKRRFWSMSPPRSYPDAGGSSRSSTTPSDLPRRRRVRPMGWTTRHSMCPCATTGPSARFAVRFERQAALPIEVTDISGRGLFSIRHGDAEQWCVLDQEAEGAVRDSLASSSFVVVRRDDVRWRVLVREEGMAAHRPSILSELSTDEILELLVAAFVRRSRRLHRASRRIRIRREDRRAPRRSERSSTRHRRHPVRSLRGRISRFRLPAPECGKGA